MAKSTKLIPRDEPHIELRKAVEAIAIKPTKGKLTLLMRKSYNVLLYHAQEQGEDLAVYCIRLSELIRNASWDSNDYSTVKEYLQRMKDTHVEWHSTSADSEKRWGISSLLAEVEIIERNGHLDVEYSFGPKIKKRLLDPDVYSKLNLKYQSMLRTNAGVALYEICSRFVNNPGGVTNRAEWKWWYPVLTGNVESETENIEYKYFKRDVLKPAISEVSQLTDIQISLIEHKDGRKISEIQFTVARKAQGSLELGARPPIDTDLLARIMKLGIPQAEAEKIYTDHDEKKLRANLETVEARLGQPGLTPVHNPAALFRDALRRNYAAAKLAQPVGKPVKKESAAADAKAAIRAKFQSHQHDEARKLFAEMLEAQQKVMLANFRLEKNGDLVLTKAFDGKGLASKRVEVAFAAWLASRTWGEPSESDLLNFAIEQGLLGGMV